MKKYIFVFVAVLMLVCVTVAQASKIKASTGDYSLAILPVVNISGVEPRAMEAAGNAIKDALNKKYPRKKTNVKILDRDFVSRYMEFNSFENEEAPTLSEMVRLGQELGADRVMHIGMMAANDKESGFMVVVGSGTVKANVTMKLKMVDVKNRRYLFNDNTVTKGSSSSVNFWRIGAPSKIRAVKKGVAEAMERFLISFD